MESYAHMHRYWKAHGWYCQAWIGANLLNFLILVIIFDYAGYCENEWAEHMTNSEINMGILVSYNTSLESKLLPQSTMALGQCICITLARFKSTPLLETMTVQIIWLPMEQTWSETTLFINHIILINLYPATNFVLKIFSIYIYWSRIYHSIIFHPLLSFKK